MLINSTFMEQECLHPFYFLIFAVLEIEHKANAFTPPTTLRILLLAFLFHKPNEALSSHV